MTPSILIVDSGIDKKLINCDVVDVLKKGEEDTCGHGTSCAMVVKSICPEAKIVSMPILDKTGKASSLELEKILNACLDIECNIINLSLSIVDSNIGNVKKICSALRRQGKIVISSVRNRTLKSEPAIFKDVIGVRGKIFDAKEKYWFNPFKRVQMITDMTPVFTDRTLGKYFVFSGNSKATAVASGIIGNIFLGNESLDSINLVNKLSSGADRAWWRISEINSSPQELILTDAKLKVCCSDLEDVKRLIKSLSCMDLENINNDDNLYEKGIIFPLFIENLIEKINIELGVKMSLINTSPSDFITINNLAYAIRRIRDEAARNRI